MKIGHIAKGRIHVETHGKRWMLFVDQKPVISTDDRRWLKRFAVKLRRTICEEQLS
jgi:hypothetical protein